MPEHSRTPASKRFLQPNSSSVSRSQVPSSSSRTGHLPRPPQTASSSPYARTPFSHRSIRRDDIETSFGEEAEAPPPILKTVGAHNHSSSAIIDSYGLIGNEDDGLIANQPATPSTSRTYKHHPVFGERGAPYSPHHDFSSPLPKRQKTAHSPSISDDPVQVSSSPSADDTQFPDSDLEENPGRYDIDGNEFASMDQVIGDRNSDSVRARFRIPSKPDDAAHQQNKRSVSRGNFRNMPMDRDPWLQAPLPSVFSPSKRKGRYDYIRGGMAETVRNWVLDIAGNQDKDVAQKGTVMDIKHVASDICGRFQLVGDSTDQIWMLIQPDNESRGSLETLNTTGKDEGTSKRVVVKGTDTMWEIDGVDFVKSGEKRGKLRVASLWHTI